MNFFFLPPLHPRILVLQIIFICVSVVNYLSFLIFCPSHFITQNPTESTGQDHLVAASSVVFLFFIKV